MQWKVIHFHFVSRPQNIKKYGKDALLFSSGIEFNFGYFESFFNTSPRCRLLPLQRSGKKLAGSPARFPSAPFCLLRPPLHQCSHFLLPFLIASCCSRGILAPLIIRLNFLTIIAVITEHALSIGNQTWVGVTRFFSFYLHSFYTYLHLLPFCLLPT